MECLWGISTRDNCLPPATSSATIRTKLRESSFLGEESGAGSRINAKGLNRNRRVTLRDIAREVGVSHTTISRALRNSPEVSEGMKDRIRRKSEEMGYVPDPLLSALSHYRLTSKEKPAQSVLAWLNPWSSPKRMREIGEFRLYWEGAKEAAERLGFILEEFCTAEVPLKRLGQVFKARNIQGVLIGPDHDLSLDGATTDLIEVDWKDFAVVRFGRSKAYPSVHFVTSAQASNTSKSFEVISERGYRRIGFVGLLLSMRIFCSGYYMAQQDTPKNRRLPPLYFQEGESVVERQDRLAVWVSNTKPDAIITDRDDLPRMLADLGYRIPEDIALATTSVHDTPIDAGIDQNPKEIGRTAIRTLVGLIGEQNFGIPQNRTEILIEGTWVDGSMLPSRSQ
ncbi:LacI family DNA-binding transcriptional regulator [Pelagicoccus sp. SDUM812005]|uniref:LacI family DNA-binding transcriptional regulator n=1 Tax=Pelagicoccus sp. SDUM812005 TaxID=3041257 RepID=UPI0028117CBC|nr:LacI family DNA-binding transcriptional regulator [Pelagicoccus sp. SDUM812005]